jgi:hypothetical protein
VLGSAVLFSLWATRNDPPIDPEELVHIEGDHPAAEASRA